MRRERREMLDPSLPLPVKKKIIVIIKKKKKEKIIKMHKHLH